MKRLYRGIFSFMLMVSCALQLGAQDTRIVPADEIPSSLRDAEAVKLTGTWETSNFSELKMALGTNGIGASNTVLAKVDLSEAFIADGTSLYVSAGFTSNGVFSGCKALKEVVMWLKKPLILRLSRKLLRTAARWKKWTLRAV